MTPIFLLFPVLIILAGLAWAGLYLFRQRQQSRRAQVREQLADAEQTLAAEFPELVAGWGGPAVLKDADAVREILQDLDKKPASETSEGLFSLVATTAIVWIFLFGIIGLAVFLSR